MGTEIVWKSEDLQQLSNVPVKGFNGELIGTAEVGKDGHVSIQLKEGSVEYGLLGKTVELALSVGYLPPEATVNEVQLNRR